MRWDTLIQRMSLHRHRSKKEFSEWKENVKTLNEARQRILKNARFRTVIKVITDINILNGLGDGETAQKEDTETAELDEMTFKFENVAISATKIKNPLSNSVIYDSGCNQLLTYDKARFVGEITPASEWVDIPNDKMLVENYETMLINDKLEDNKTIKMKFAKTAYISFINMTLVSLNKLKKKDYVWNMQEDVLIDHKSDQKVCDIEEHYDLATIEFNSMNVTVEKITSSLAKEDASEENPPIVTKEDVPNEEKKNTMQNNDAPTLKKSDTDPVLTAVTAASGEQDHEELNATVLASDWLKSVPDNLKWTDQKEDLIQSANELKKRRSLISKKRCKKSRSLIKKRCKKRRLKISKPLYGTSKQQNRFWSLITNLNMTSLKLIHLFQSWGSV